MVVGKMGWQVGSGHPWQALPGGAAEWVAPLHCLLGFHRAGVLSSLSSCVSRLPYHDAFRKVLRASLAAASLISRAARIASARPSSLSLGVT